jgi:tungstate transport system permease protein
MKLIWDELKVAVPLIFHGNPYLWSIVWFTVQVAVVATVMATVLGLPVAALLALGRFRGRGVLQWFANAGIALPPVLVGLGLYLLFIAQGPLGSLHLVLSKRSVFIAQTVLALPYVVALGAVAMQRVDERLLGQARLLGAKHTQIAVLALREARIGVIGAIVAALGVTLSEVGALVIVGGNVYSYNQTLASSMLFDAQSAHYAGAIASGIVLLGLILILLGGLSLFQERRVTATG